MKKYNLMITAIIVFSITIPSFIIYKLIEYKDTQIDSVENILVQEAKSHFNNAVMTRKWNASFNGVYVKKTSLIEPNPYLEDNHIFSKDNEMLVKINPAWMTRQISEISNKYTNYYFKITSLNPLNPKNIPDSFEKEGLNFFNKNKDKKFYYKLDENNNFFNFIGALKVDQSCLTCHAEQGYNVGDIRGGIRLSIPITSHNAKINQIKSNTLVSIIVIIVFTIVITLLLIRFILIIVKKSEKYLNLNKTLEKRVASEITKNKEKEKILSEQTKMIALGEMLTNISHQWRQPLSIITTATSGIQIKNELNRLDDSEIKETTNIIMEQASYMSKTIDDFRNYFQEDKEKTRFILKDLILKDIELIKSSYTNNDITIEINDVTENISLYGYRNELLQSILNLLKNSKDQFEHLSINNKVIKFSTQVEENKIKIFMQDNAGGISKKIINKIFEPYFTTKHQSQGTGIGLYMTQKVIVEHFDGEIFVSNKKMIINKKSYNGACFEIILPIMSEID